MPASRSMCASSTPGARVPAVGGARRDRRTRRAGRLHERRPGRRVSLHRPRAPPACGGCRSRPAGARHLPRRPAARRRHRRPRLRARRARGGLAAGRDRARRRPAAWHRLALLRPGVARSVVHRAGRGRGARPAPGRPRRAGVSRGPPGLGRAVPRRSRREHLAVLAARATTREWRAATPSCTRVWSHRSRRSSPTRGCSAAASSRTSWRSFYGDPRRGPACQATSR